MPSSSNRSSSATDRLSVVYQAYKSAFARRASDLKQATTAAQVQAIMDNVDSLEASYLDAARQSLDATGADIEACYQTALSATQKVEKAYADGKALAERITAVAGVVSAVGSLVTAAAGAGLV
jgi:hypothetical protein